MNLEGLGLEGYPIRLFISDFDHTITYGRDSDWTAFKLALKGASLPYPDRETFFAMRRGSDSRKVALRLCNNVRELSERVLKTREKLMDSAKVQSRAKLRPGVKKSLRQLRHNVTFLAIASTGNRAAVGRFLREKGLRSYFDAVEVREIKGKSPTESQQAKRLMYLELLSRFDVGPAETLVLGNSVNDVRPAFRLGCGAIAVAGDYGVEKGLADIAYIVADWSEFLRSLRRSGYRTGHFGPRAVDSSAAKKPDERTFSGRH